MSRLLTRHWRMIAAWLAVAALGAAGGATVTTWAAGRTVNAGTITAGDLNVRLAAAPAWATVGAGGTKTAIDPNDHIVTPGEHLVMTAAWQVTAKGENFNAHLTFGDHATGDPPALSSSMAPYLDTAGATWGVLAGTVAPAAAFAAPLVSGPYGTRLAAIDLTETADQATYTTYLDVTVKSTATLADLENRLLTVDNLGADLRQFRGVN